MARRSKARAPCCRAIDTANARSSCPRPVGRVELESGQASQSKKFRLEPSFPGERDLFEVGIGGGESFLGLAQLQGERRRSDQAEREPRSGRRALRGQQLRR